MIMKPRRQGDPTEPFPLADRYRTNTLVDYGKNFVEVVAELGICMPSCTRDITVLPTTERSGVKEIRIVPFYFWGDSPTVAEVLETFNVMGYRAAEAIELLHFMKNNPYFPEVFKPDVDRTFLGVALGSIHEGTYWADALSASRSFSNDNEVSVGLVVASMDNKPWNNTLFLAVQGTD